MKEMDRETVITHLQIIHIWAEFARERDLQFFTAKHLEDIAQWADDALALLKEHKDLENLQQDPVEAELEGGGHTWWYVCGECHTAIDTRDKFCRECGRRINWGTMKAKGGVKNVKETDGAE
ncbi:MAG: hypothetical protein II008_22155 [Oscillospiraceae bacterium]|nr:hypothetical protein [Oscillospiraceae bacterium]